MRKSFAAEGSDPNAAPFCCRTIEAKYDPGGAALSSRPVQSEVVDNRPASVTDETLTLSPYGTAFAGDAWRPGDTPEGHGKVSLNVLFLSGTDGQINEWKSAASAWMATVIGTRVVFNYTTDKRRSHLRIDFNPKDGDWSYVGRDNLNHGRSAKTMNNATISQHSIQHEIGHVLGLRHEHQFPGDEIQWHPDVVIAYMKQWHWDEDMTREQILTKFSHRYTCLKDNQFNPKSVMMYPILSGWADLRDPLTGEYHPWVTPSNSEISDRDVKCAAGLYAA
jgi:hypothetical protein